MIHRQKLNFAINILGQKFIELSLTYARLSNESVFLAEAEVGTLMKR